MGRQRTSHILLTIGGLALAFPTPSTAQLAAPSSQAPASRTPSYSGAEYALLRSLQANPLTAPYPFSTETRGKQILLRGRVGTKQVHDVAIQTAIALGIPVIDGLIIDTAAAHQAAAFSAQGGGPPMAGNGPAFPAAGTYGSLPYTYPQPILGKLDDPFFGFEPPAIGYPPWWNAMTARRLGVQAYPMPPGAASNAPAPNPSDGSANAMPYDASNAPTGPIPYGTIDMAIDPRGVATLRGTVPSLAERITLGQKVAQAPGVTQVVNLLNVQAMPPTPSDTPPPPPTPSPVTAAPAPRPALVGDGPPIYPDGDPVGQRASKAIGSRAALTGQPVKVRVRDGVASITGRVPTVYEAMLAYRSVQQTPGVREVEDRLEFVVPDGSAPNPLVEKGRPEDVEPYLEAQIRRQVGDLAHVDRVRVQGASLDLRGTLGREEDRDRFDAILRSMPILRGFRMTAEMPAESR